MRFDEFGKFGVRTMSDSSCGSEWELVTGTFSSQTFSACSSADVAADGGRILTSCPSLLLTLSFKVSIEIFCLNCSIVRLLVSEDRIGGFVLTL